MTIRIGGKAYPLPTGAGGLERLLADVLGVEKLPVQLWDRLEDQAFVTGAIVPPNERGVRDCLKEARDFLHAHPKLVTGHDPGGVDVPVVAPPGLVTDADLARAEFYSAHVAGLARSRQDVRGLRKRLFGRKTLSPMTAGAFLISDATRFLHPDDFKIAGIPLTGHRTELVKPNGQPAVIWSEGVKLRIVWNGGSHEVPYRRDWYERVSHSNRQIAIPAMSGRAILKPVAQHSVLDQVRAVSLELTRAYPWEEHEAVWFLLTDFYPQLGPIRAAIRARRGFALEDGRITLVIEPWVAADTVYAVYHHLQNENFLASSKPFGREKLQLYTFVEPRRRKPRSKPTWDALTLAWNRTRPKHAYDDFRPFRKDYHRVAQWVETQVLLPGYKLFARPSPTKQATKSGVRKRRGQRRIKT